jgi:hypothetical protein
MFPLQPGRRKTMKLVSRIESHALAVGWLMPQSAASAE